MTSVDMLITSNVTPVAIRNVVEVVCFAATGSATCSVDDSIGVGLPLLEAVVSRLLPIRRYELRR